MSDNTGTRRTRRRLSGAALVALCCWWAGGCIVPIQVAEVEFDGISPPAAPLEPAATEPAATEPTVTEPAITEPAMQEPVMTPSEAISTSSAPAIIVALPPVEEDPTPNARDEIVRIELPPVEEPLPTFPSQSLNSLPVTAGRTIPVVVMSAFPVPQPAAPAETLPLTPAAPLPPQPALVPRSLAPAALEPVAVLPATPPHAPALPQPSAPMVAPPVAAQIPTPLMATRPAVPQSAPRSPFIPAAAPAAPALPAIPAMPFVPAASLPPREIPFVQAMEINAPAEVLPPGNGSPRPVPLPSASQGELAGVQRIKTIREINIDITPPELQGDDGQRMAAPVDYASEWFAEVPVRNGDDRFERDYDYIPIPEGMEFCYQPLYFEEVNVERYGRNFGLLQPVVSAAHFYGNIPLLPYKTFAQPARRCTYHAHWSLPGYRQPWWEKRPPIISLDAAAMQSLATWGIILLIP